MGTRLDAPTLPEGVGVRRPIALTDAELYALLFASNVARDDDILWDDLPKRERAAHERANDKLRREARKRRNLA
jgi:hypothetical protein